MKTLTYLLFCSVIYLQACGSNTERSNPVADSITVDSLDAIGSKGDTNQVTIQMEDHDIQPPASEATGSANAEEILLLENQSAREQLLKAIDAWHLEHEGTTKSATDDSIIPLTAAYLEDFVANIEFSRIHTAGGAYRHYHFETSQADNCSDFIRLTYNADVNQYQLQLSNGYHVKTDDQDDCMESDHVISFIIKDKQFVITNVTYAG
ncbi:hypothetical protein PBAL39_02965 [Pedobacter sp. BAL39]|uniref:hypothetical protein n=1 Tax=Pedobacter sp. BAL39 TaxID=391596 RepID=UPI0001559593|nr:hypothetical protein [Pedobacter sp. BAL39]EDM34823.1 hypothetical protein PBAL39_02965 [Pedobacter sp. BAL39]